MRNTAVFVLLTGILLVSAWVNIWIGSVNITVMDVLKALIGQGDPDQAYIILHYRMPRIVLAMLAGICFAVSGVIAQAILLNPLASPDTLGISGGAAIGAVSVGLIVPLAPSAFIAGAAFLGASLAAILIYVFTFRKGFNPQRMALIGIAVSACCSSIVQLLLTMEKMNLSTALLWLNGSLWGRTWDQVIQTLPSVLLLVPGVWILAKVLDILGLGEKMAKGLGVSTERMTLLMLSFSVLLASFAVAAVGTIGFVGLIAPHLARKLVGTGHRLVLPAAGLLGALLILIADTLGRGVMPPIEVPAGIVTSIIGAPYFLFLLWQQSKFGNR